MWDESETFSHGKILCCWQKNKPKNKIYENCVKTGNRKEDEVNNFPLCTHYLNVVSQSAICFFHVWNIDSIFIYLEYLSINDRKWGSFVGLQLKVVSLNRNQHVSSLKSVNSLILSKLFWMQINTLLIKNKRSIILNASLLTHSEIFLKTLFCTKKIFAHKYFIRKFRRWTISIGKLCNVIFWIIIVQKNIFL